MKKLLLSAVCALAIAFSAHGQKPVAVSNHSVNLHLLGLGYTYEHSFGGDFTLLGTVSLDAGLAWGTDMWSEDYFVYAVRPSIAIQPRYYYNFAQRADKGKNTNLNSANFVALQMLYGFPSIIHEDVRLVSIMYVCPVWGLRRVWSDRWLLEFWAGPSFATAFENTNSSAAFELQFDVMVELKFGYVF